jgi:hypothetical protein
LSKLQPGENPVFGKMEAAIFGASTEHEHEHEHDWGSLRRLTPVA